MSVQILVRHSCFGGEQLFCQHRSQLTSTVMRFAVFVPPQARTAKVPILWFLSGLTCTEENFVIKAGAQRVAAQVGITLVVPDTSPRGDQIPVNPDGAYDLGVGASFYVDATRDPWRANYQMRSYLEVELPEIIAAGFSADLSRQSIMGHSMGGHGALMLALRSPERFASVSAFSPITSLINCGWGQKALLNYLGGDRTAWRQYDCCELISDGARIPHLLVDQGTSDPFLETQLFPDLLKRACASSDINLTLRYQHGYDHSYFFVATFIEEHVRWHAQRLNAKTASNLARAPNAQIDARGAR